MLNRFGAATPCVRRASAAVVVVVLVLVLGTSAWSGTGNLGSAPRDVPPAPRCLAIVASTVRGVEGSAAELSASVRDLLVTYLAGPSIRVFQPQARVVSQAVEEAKQQGCGYVLTTTVTRSRRGGTFGKVFGQAAGSAAWYIPGGSTAKSAVARGVAVGTAQAIAGLASTTKARDELQFEYRVSSLAGANLVGPKNDKAKATVDGEDLLTPLVERAAESIVAAVVK